MKFTGRIVDYHSPDEWADIFKAECPDEAAEELVERHWSDDPTDPATLNYEVQVKDLRGNISTYRVTAEADVRFYSTKIR